MVHIKTCEVNVAWTLRDLTISGLIRHFGTVSLTLGTLGSDTSGLSCGHIFKAFGNDAAFSVIFSNVFFLCSAFPNFLEGKICFGMGKALSNLNLNQSLWRDAT